MKESDVDLDLIIHVYGSVIDVLMLSIATEIYCKYIAYVVLYFEDLDLG
jgi:hypothetical protein